ncbi:MAG: ABC transporter substrate-binding protein [Terriglobia bacterium]
MKQALLLLLMALALLSMACNTQPNRVVIGVVINQTQHPAIQLAVNEINAGGGIDGVPLEIAGMDWGEIGPVDTRSILTMGKRFDETKNLVAVIGHSDSTATLSAAAFYNLHKIPQIVTIATNPSITNIGNWTYRLCLSDAAQGPALAEYAVRDLQKKRIAVFYVNDEYGRGLARLFEKRVEELGGEIVSSVMHRNVLKPDDENLITSVLSEMTGKDSPDLFALFQRTGASGWTIRAIRKAGIQAQILGGDTLGATDFVASPPEATEGIRMSQFFLPQANGERSMKFVRDYLEFAHQMPDYGHAFAYDAVYLIRDAVRYGGFSREGVKSYLDRIIREQIETTGVAGPYTLNADHDARRSLAIVEIHNGKQRFVKALSIN